MLLGHLWLGVVSAPLLVLLGLTGAALVFEDEIAAAVNSRILKVPPGGCATLPIGAFARGLAPGARVVGTAADLRDPMRRIHQLHTRLLAAEAGSAVVTWAAVALFLLAAGGIVLWWPRKIYRPGGAGKRFAFDLHNALAIWSWAFLLFFAVTGAVVHWGEAAGVAPQRVTATCKGVPPASPDGLLAAAIAADPGRPHQRLPRAVLREAADAQTSREAPLGFQLRSCGTVKSTPARSSAGGPAFWRGSSASAFP